MGSSYDRRGGNHDWSSYLRREGRQAVMMEAEGPGCINRIWTADPQKGVLRIFIDGHSRPALEAPFSHVFELLPLSFGIGGESPENYARAKADHLPMGHTNYCPIPFRTSCKVTIEPEDDYLYYHVNAHLYPPGTNVESFHSPASMKTDAVRKAEAAIANWGAGKPLVDMGAANRFEFELKPGERKVLGSWNGPGAVRGIRLTLPAGIEPRESEHVRENLWLVAHFDDDEPRDPSVRAPVGPFFLNFGQALTPRSVFCGTDKEGPYCFFPMPHRERAGVALVNRSLLAVRVSGAVLHQPLAEFDPDLFRFRATWHVENPFGPDHRDYEGLACRLLNLDGFYNYEMLHAFGAGHFVGCGFCADLREAPTDRAAGEGDEMFFIDDDPRLTMYGTGTEDYVNDAWGMHGYVGPLSGDSVTETADLGPQLFGYRLHVPDPVPFTRSGRFTLEHGTGNNCSGLYRSIAYWYMDPATARTRIEERRWEELRTGVRKPNTD